MTYNLPFDPGKLTRSLQFWGQTTTDVDGTPERAYALVRTVKGSIKTLSMGEGILSGQETNTASVEIEVYYHQWLFTELESYEKFVINESSVEPVYLRDLSGDIMLDLNYYPMIDEEQTQGQKYEIVGIDRHMTETRSLKITARRWR